MALVSKIVCAINFICHTKIIYQCTGFTCGKYIYTNDNHVIIKNHVGKNNHGINCAILKFLWSDLFILFEDNFTLVNVQVVVIMLFSNCKMEDNFMKL